MDDLERYRRRMAVRQRHLKKLGARNVQCICGETDPICFEPDHVFRRKNSPVTWGICKNCHAKKTARDITESPKVGLHPGNLHERQAHALRGIIIYHEFMVGHLREISEELSKLADEEEGPES